MSDTATNGAAELETEDEALSVLMDGDIDKVMSGLDRIIEAAPSYEKLFMRWQRQHWSTEDFSFEEDVKQWNDPDLMTEEEKRFMLFGFSQFFLGEERVTVELIPFALATPNHEAQVFLTTQISDEAKHMVFFDRFYREVLGMKADGIGEMLGTQRNNVNEHWEKLFDGILHECAENLRKDPTDFASLVRGITVYMIVIEGTLALTGARFIIRAMKEREWLPGFTAGFTAVNRDESRHVGFGVKFLSEAIKDDPANARIIEDTLKEVLPVATLVFVPPWVEDPYNFSTPFYESSEVFAYSLKALSKKCAAMGLDPTLLGAAGIALAKHPPGNALQPHIPAGEAEEMGAVKRGRPSTGARERILEAAIEVMKAEGYAGTTLAKVAARSGESKALVAYHYGSKQGLVATVASAIAREITDAVLSRLGEGGDVEAVIANAAAGVESILDADERVARIYFDLAAVSVVDSEVHQTIAAINEGWRQVLNERFAQVGLSPAKARGLTVMVIAGIQGLALERIERGSTPELREARDLFIAAAAAVAGH